MKILEMSFEDREILVSVNGAIPEWYEIVYHEGKAGIMADGAFYPLYNK